jgi:hypothetical protein
MRSISCLFLVVLLSGCSPFMSSELVTEPGIVTVCQLEVNSGGWGYSGIEHIVEVQTPTRKLLLDHLSQHWYETLNVGDCVLITYRPVILKSTGQQVRRIIVSVERVSKSHQGPC